MMISRVKPLHKMVEQTTIALDEAVEKLSGMESKLRNLNDRMVSLSGKYEDASVDKSRQGLLTDDQQHQLSRAAYFEKVTIVNVLCLSNHFVPHLERTPLRFVVVYNSNPTLVLYVSQLLFSIVSMCYPFCSISSQG